MKATGIIRKIDHLGRIVLPVEIREQLKLAEKTPIEIFTDDDGVIILKKYTPACLFCGNAEDMILFNGKQICRTCLAAMNDLAK